MPLAIKTITPQIDSPLNYTQKCWQYRQLVILMVKRELSIKYAGSQVGKWWLLIYPLVTLSIYKLISHYIFKVQPNGVPYVLFALSGIIPWTLFSSIVVNSANVFPANRDLIKKSYFPKAALLIVKILVGLLEMLVTMIIYFLLMLVFHFPLTDKVLLLPFAIVCNALVAFSFALWITMLSIRYKDIFQAVPLLINLMLWLTPVFYPVTMFPKKLLPLAYCNPMTFVLDAYRFSLIGATFEPLNWLISLIISIGMFISGVWFFIRYEDRLVESL